MFTFSNNIVLKLILFKLIEGKICFLCILCTVEINIKGVEWFERNGCMEMLVHYPEYTYNTIHLLVLRIYTKNVIVIFTTN